MDDLSPATPATAVAGRPDASGAALEATGLVVAYGGRRALDGLDLRAEHGRVTALLGPNGAGKTTAISCATGLLRPDEGRVRVLDEDPWGASPSHRARVGVMVQDGGLTSGVPAAVLLRYAASLYADPLDVTELSEFLGIDEFSGTLVRRLSGGQRQRLALALAVVGRPELVFLDEPTAGMDPTIRRRVRRLVRSLARTGTAVVLSTHLMDDVVGLADEVHVLAHGRILAAGGVQDVIARHRADAGAHSLHARLDQVSPGRRAALEQDLRTTAARHGASIELSAGGAAELEAVLLDLVQDEGAAREPRPGPAAVTAPTEGAAT